MCAVQFQIHWDMAFEHASTGSRGSLSEAKWQHTSTHAVARRVRTVVLNTSRSHVLSRATLCVVEARGWTVGCVGHLHIVAPMQSVRLVARAKKAAKEEVEVEEVPAFDAELAMLEAQAKVSACLSVRMRHNLECMQMCMCMCMEVQLMKAQPHTSPSPPPAFSPPLPSLFHHNLECAHWLSRRLALPDRAEAIWVTFPPHELRACIHDGDEHATQQMKFHTHV